MTDPEKTGWDKAYWCSTHEVAHTASELMAEHRRSGSAEELDVERLARILPDWFECHDEETAREMAAHIAAAYADPAACPPGCAGHPVDHRHCGPECEVPGLTAEGNELLHALAATPTASPTDTWGLREALDDPERFGWKGPPAYAIAYAAAIRDVKAALAATPTASPTEDSDD